MKRLWLPREKHTEKMLQRLDVGLFLHWQVTVDLISKQCASSLNNKVETNNVHYKPVIASLLHAMDCTKPDIAHVIGVVS